MSKIIKAFENVISSSFIPYKGCIIEKSIDEYFALKKSYSSLEKAKKAIDESFANLKKTIA
jgi:hypothetical protein